MKKLICALFGLFISLSASFAEEPIANKATPRVTIPWWAIHVTVQQDPDLSSDKDALDRMAKEYDRIYNESKDGKLTTDDVWKICGRGNKILHKSSICYERVLLPALNLLDIVLFGDACLDGTISNIPGGVAHCIDDVFTTEYDYVVRGQWQKITTPKRQEGKYGQPGIDVNGDMYRVNRLVTHKSSKPYAEDVKVPEYTAFGLAIEYIRNQGFDLSGIRCSPKIEDNWILCTAWKDPLAKNANFYTFKFADTHSRDDWIYGSDVYYNIGRGICALVKNRVYTRAGPEPICEKQCSSQVKDVAKKFAMETKNKTYTYYTDLVFENEAVGCELSPQEHLAIDTKLKTYRDYEHMSTAFEHIQTALTPGLINILKLYVQAQGIDVKSFTCNYAPRKIVEDYALMCTLNGIDFEFLFDDLYEGSVNTRIIGDSGMKCLLQKRAMGGTATFDGKFCRGPTREQCVGKTGKCDEGSLCAKIPGGTSWDEDAGACVLNDAKAAKDAERLRWVIGGMTVGLVLTILTGGEVDWVIADIAAGVLLEDAFKEIDRFNETRPNQLATDYINDAKTCGLIDGDDKKTCIDKQCIINLVKKYYASIYDVIGSNATALNDTQLEIFEKVNGRINGCLTDSELKSAMKKSIRLPKDIITEQASVVLMGLGFFACPSNFISKIKNLTNTYRLFSRAGFTHIESATEVINGMRYNRLYLDGLNSSQTKNLERALTGKNLSFSRKTSEGRQFLEFYDRNVSNIVNIEHTATGIKVGKWNFETTADNSLGVSYYERLFDDPPKELADNLYDDFGVSVAMFKRDDKYVLAVFDNTDDFAKAQKVLGQRNLLMDIPLTEDQISNVLKDIYEESKVGNKVDLEILIPKLRNAGLYNEKNAARMADDLANEAAQRIRFFDANHETGIVDRLKRYYSLTEEEKVGLLMDLQGIIGHIRRDPTGKTQIGCVFSQRGSSVSGFGTPDRPFEFKYGIKNGTAEDMVDDIFHENTHAYQRQGKSSLSKQVVDFNLENYAPPEMDYDLYLQNIIEAEAWDVGSRAARRLFIILGL